ncbi:MAG: T9SS type A sorting domain-containing protein, partial [ANME-2 cluster archaeon]
MKILWKIVFSVLLLNLFSLGLRANIINVPDLKYPTIQAGIDSSSHGDTVLVTSGTYYENINFNGKNIVLCSQFIFSNDSTDITETVIDGNRAGCVVVFENGEDSNAVIMGFTITGGYVFLYENRGGGISCLNNSSPNIFNLVIRHNEVYGNAHNYGGAGVLCKGKSAPAFDRIKMIENDASGSSGGAVRCMDSSRISIKNSIIQKNKSANGTLFILNSHIALHNVLIEKNDASMRGGGLYLEKSSAIVENSQIIDNQVKVMGGGIFCSESSLLLNNVNVSKNSATEAFDGGAGGGFYIESNSSLNIENSIISQNIAQGSGGGIEITESSLLMDGVILISNRVDRDGNGGGISASNRSEIIVNRVKFIDNYSPKNGGGIYCADIDVIIYLDRVTVSNNKAFEEGGGIYFRSANNLIFSEQNLSSIYLNKAGTRGADLFYYGNESIEILLDSITVSNPTEYHYYPIDKFTVTSQQPLFNSVNADLYVSTTGSDLNKGTSPDTPLKSINSAVQFASADSNNHRFIHVDSGIYSQSTTLEDFPLYGRNNITILGNADDPPILDAESISGILLLNKTENFGLNNFILQHGKADDGGAIYGKKILNIKIENLIFRNNSAQYRGSAICLWGNIGTISDSKPIEFKNTLFHNNSIDSSLYEGACIAIIGDTKIKFINVTIADNYINAGYQNSSQSAGLFIYGWYKSELSIVNSIFNNNLPNDLIVENRTDVIFSNSNIPRGKNGIIRDSLTIIHWLNGNIDEDPLFVGGDPFDYHILPESPCINAGIAFLEFDGDTIVNLLPEEYAGVAPDIGAYGINSFNSITNNKNTASRFHLFQNYPNPFNNSTIIKFRISDPASVNISIYDITGKRVKTLCESKKTEGIHFIKWNSSNLASGIYFCRLSTETNTIVRKMLLLK